MDETGVVTCFLRHEGSVLLFRRSREVGSYEGMWGAVAGHAESDPDTAARREIREETGLDAGDVTLLRRGEPFAVPDEHLDKRWHVHPYLFDCATRTVETNWETADHAWVAPTAIIHRETVPGLWTSYDRVRPSVGTVADDHEHGSAYVSVRALEVLRDEASVRAYTAATDQDPTPGSAHLTARTDNGEPLPDIAVSLREARPSMAVVENRVDRVMAAAGVSRTATAVEHAAAAGVEEALRADERAASHAARRVAGARVATLSRSGTVRETLSLAEPEAVLVAESRPGREGVDAAADLAESTDVTLTTDAALASAICEWDADAVVLGADAIRPDGSVINKAGTRAAALAGTYEGIEVLVVAATDKVVSHTRTDREHRNPTEVYDGGADVVVHNPTFEATPPDCVDAVVTEHGPLDRDGVAAIAADHRERGRWADEWR